MKYQGLKNDNNLYYVAVRMLQQQQADTQDRCT